MTTPEPSELEAILTLYEQNCMRIREAPVEGEILAVSITHQLETATQKIQSIIDTQTKLATTELLDSLYWMYTQYCGRGHDFMGAGEFASELLENAGYITVDRAGQIIKDNGDSEEQRLREKIE